MSTIIPAPPGAHAHLETEAGETSTARILFFAISPNSNVNLQNHYTVRAIDVDGNHIWNICDDRDCTY